MYYVYIVYSIIFFNTFGDTYFITINGYEIINPLCEGLIEVFCVNHRNIISLYSNIIYYKKVSSMYTIKTIQFMVFTYLVVK